MRDSFPRERRMNDGFNFGNDGLAAFLKFSVTSIA
jgi:hypothetical protein